MARELPATRAVHLNRRCDEAFAAKDRGDGRASGDTAAPKELREVREPLFRGLERAPDVDGCDPRVLDSRQFCFERPYALGLFPHRRKQGIHIPAARDRVGKVLRLASKGVKARPVKAIKDAVG